MTRQLQVVQLPATKTPLRPSPGFAKKQLSDYALDIMGLCEYGCAYCSSNEGNFLRIRRELYAAETERQLGERLLPASSPDLHFRWPDVLTRLTLQLIDESEKRRQHPFGTGKTCVFSMLTDGFSPRHVADGTTKRALQLLLEFTGFRIRVLTKNACVGSDKWIKFFAQHPGRFVVGLSIGTTDDEWSKRIEVGTSPPSQRVKALRHLQDNGIPTFGMLCPIFPDVQRTGHLESLVAAIRPLRCETVWAEPYNDRANWKRVRAGYEQGSKPWQYISDVFEGGAATWSRYASALGRRLIEIAERDGWLDKLVYLLYEDKITAEGAETLSSLRGVLLQSDPDEHGRSRNPHIARMQEQHG